MSPRDITRVDDVLSESVSVPCGVGALSGKLYRPATSVPRAAVLISPATGVRQDYYAAFARWLAASEGVAVLTYDYSDFGASESAPLSVAKATMATWAIRDLAAARAYLMASFSEVPIWLIGHSLGAMLLHLHRGMDRVERIVAVASGPAYWRNHPMPFRLLAWLFWYGPAPLLTRLLGYLPGRRLGFGSDLPRGVYWQWRRWCTTPEAYDCDIGSTLPEPPIQSVTARIKFVAIADDVMIPPTLVWRLMAHYPHAPKRQLTIHPREYGLMSIGHIGPFAARNAAIWPDIMRDFRPPRPATGQHVGCVRDAPPYQVRTGPRSGLRRSGRSPRRQAPEAGPAWS